ncbi:MULTISPECIES: sigma-70 family RNA polymerase sigma factor [Pseudofrankia]|uniref:sigma-70 family RNA polymerase sigma factor n=1 Tax=Pseudofrankia TaxID=2994363 RepID=UPI000234CE39|nr:MULTISPECIES: sigma-70 family RNA polymerase sigma factor [Pseudofrankia]
MTSAAVPAPERAEAARRRHFGDHLVRDCGPALERYVSRLLPGDPGRTEDIVQETFLRAWRHADLLTGLTEEEDLRRWLFRVAHNVAVDWLRRRAARPLELGGDLPVLPDPAGQDQLEAVLLRGVLATAFEALSGPHRATLVHLYWLDRSHAEVAAELGIPAGTVKSRHHVAVRELRAALTAHGVTDAHPRGHS